MVRTVGPRALVALLICAVGVSQLRASAATGADHDAVGPAVSSPIRHVVVIMQENHTFDNVFGYWCTRTRRCDGTRWGRLSTGARISLGRAVDVVPLAGHSNRAHRVAWHGGAMDRFNELKGCGLLHGFACYTQFRLTDIPNLGALAKHFVIADRIFETDGVPSWGSHLELATGGRLDGFTGDLPVRPPGTVTNGWGCDSLLDAAWRPTPKAAITFEPSCVPDQQGDGPYRPSPVRWIPTIMDRLSDAGLSWKIYSLLPSMTSDVRGYGWAICPTFADCLYTSQARNNVPYPDILTDATSGVLPNFSIVTPPSEYSQHNACSMVLGDNYIGQTMSALMHGPEWSSTAVIITYDDFGGFYDHVASPDGSPAFRMPFVIASPWAKPAFTDHHLGNLTSILAFVEHTFGLQPLTRHHDSTVYDLDKAFDFTQVPLQPIPMTRTLISRREAHYLREHPPSRADIT